MFADFLHILAIKSVYGLDSVTEEPPLYTNVHEIDNYGGGSLKVWADIMLDDHTPVNVLERGSVTGVRYRDEVLESYFHHQSYRSCLGRSVEGNCNSLPLPRTIQKMKTALLKKWDQLPI
ncbi:transposable element Tc1 transposase [Trichonephila clavipes]|nr:transposable element Tc1 transposase [Trichonephila clavipes]